jgi:hypothetical protein
MGKIIWTDGVKMKYYLQFRMSNAVTRSKTNWSYILRRICILGRSRGRQKGREDEEEA